jgi:hypothetical protein
VTAPPPPKDKPPQRRFAGPVVVFGGIVIVVLIASFVVYRIAQTPDTPVPGIPHETPDTTQGTPAAP